VATKEGDKRAAYLWKYMVEKISVVIGEVNFAADALTGASEEVSTTSQGGRRAASAQAPEVEEDHCLDRGK